METKASKQSTSIYMRILTSPIRVLGKARDMYVKSLMGCANNSKFSYAGAGGFGSNTTQLPRSFSVNSTRSSVSSEEDEHFVMLLRASLKRNNSCAGVNDVSKLAGGTNGNDVKNGMGGMRSQSAGLGKIGRIDEDKCCDEFEEVGADQVIINRSRSYAVKRNGKIH